MGLFDKIKAPIFLKEESSLSDQLIVLENLLKTAPLEAIKKLEQEIRNVKSGIIGEQQIAFELKNSHIPMYILHDLYLEHEGLTAQIDFLVLTRRRNFIIECKNLYGNIEITHQGDFIRNIGYNGKFFKERIYSPITQNERHMALIKQVRASERKNIFTQTLFEKNFHINYRSVVVLANPKTVLNDKYAHKELKEQVIPVDRLVAHIKKINAESEAENCYENDLTNLAHFFLELNKPAPDYTQRYLQLLKSDSTEGDKALEQSDINSEKELVTLPAKAHEALPLILCPKCNSPMILRTAAKGEKAGNTFYGCSRFPKCRSIINIC